MQPDCDSRSFQLARETDLVTGNSETRRMAAAADDGRNSIFESLNLIPAMYAGTHGIEPYSLQRTLCRCDTGTPATHALCKRMVSGRNAITIHTSVA
jgi:hypothetical protein